MITTLFLSILTVVFTFLKCEFCFFSDFTSSNELRVSFSEPILDLCEIVNFLATGLNLIDKH